MAKIIKFPKHALPMDYILMSNHQIGMLMDAHRTKSFRYGLSVGLVSGAAFTLLGFVLAFLFR